jgi:hypothetical protein
LSKKEAGNLKMEYFLCRLNHWLSGKSTGSESELQFPFLPLGKVKSGRDKNTDTQDIKREILAESCTWPALLQLGYFSLPVRARSAGCAYIYYSLKGRVFPGPRK